MKTTRLIRMSVLLASLALASACGGGDGDGGGSSSPPPNSPPAASFTATTASGTEPHTVQFDASASSDSGGSITSYSWHFGDNTAAESGMTISHVFQFGGTYLVTLTVTDNLGATISTSRTVTLSPYSVVHAFIGGAEGTHPYDGVIGDGAGNLYGTTWAGGDLSCDCGTVFMVDAGGNLLTLHRFAGPPTDGALPSGPLTRDAAGNLYGTTSSGGNGADPAGYGTVFKIDAAGIETVLHHFTGGKGGFEPAGGVLRDSNGNLYGVTASGGLPCPSSDGCGTVFRLEPDGTFTTLHRFAADGAEGTRPSSGLIADAAGNLYGVTSGWPFGGNGRDNGRGIVFRIDSAGVFTMLYDFATDSVAAHPMGPLMRDDAGNLYGVTATGGDEDGGTIFKLDPEGEISILHEFGHSDPWLWIASDDPGGTFPLAGLVGDPAGIVYGTTASGGVTYSGVVYQFDLQSHEFTVLHTFRDVQGGGVQAPLLRDSAGDLYGTTWSGGDLTCNPPNGCGTVFRIY